MTDEQQLAFLFAKDAGTKAVMFFQQKRTINDMINSIKQATVSQNVPPSPPPPPPPRQEYEQKPQEDEDFVNVESVKPDVIIMPPRRRGRPTKNK